MKSSSHSCPRALPMAMFIALPLAAPCALAQDARLVADGIETSADDAAYSSSSDGAAGHAVYALNDGIITLTGPTRVQTAGVEAHGVRAESGGHIDFSGREVTTTGAGASALSVGQGASVQARAAAGGTLALASSGRESRVVDVDGGALQLDAATINAAGVLGGGLVVRNGGTAKVDNVLVQASGQSSVGILVADGELDLSNAAVLTTEISARAMRVGSGGVARVSHSHITSSGSSGAAITVERGGRLSFVSGEVNADSNALQVNVEGIAQVEKSILRSTAGEPAASIYAGHLQADDTHFESLAPRGHGMFLGNNGTLDMRGGSILGGFMGLNINGAGNVVTLSGVDVESRSDNGMGIWLPNVSQLDVVGGNIRSLSSSSIAIENRAGRVSLDGTRVSTRGRSAHALLALPLNGRVPPVFNVAGSKISTEGAFAIGAFASGSGQISLTDSLIDTSGEGAYGVKTLGTGGISLSHTHVTTRGLGAFAAVVSGEGRLDVDGGSLVSQRHGALWIGGPVRELNLRNGARLQGGNGVLAQIEDTALIRPLTIQLDKDVQADGDIIMSPGTAPVPGLRDLHLVLSRGSQWRGASEVLGSVTMSGQSHWTLTGDSHIGRLQLTHSTLQLSEGYAGRFHRLTVDGDAAFDGATLVFNGALGDDGALADRLHVRGDTSGSAGIVVNNVGGAGAQTRNGIQLIQVDGRSDADFQLQGRAVAGGFEYFLHRGGVGTPDDGGWYLRSELAAVGDPCRDDPTLPGCTPITPPPEDCHYRLGNGIDCAGGGTPQPCEVDDLDDCRPRPPQILRPEAGAYLANQYAAGQVFRVQRNDRLTAGGSGDGMQGWARVDNGHTRLGQVGGQLAITSNRNVLQAGADVGVADEGRARAGVLLGTARASSRSHAALTGYAAQARLVGRALGAYGGWADERAYVEATLQHARFRNRVQGDGLAAEHYRSRALQSSLEGGYRFEVGELRGTALSLQPELQLLHTRLRTAAHEESNGTRVWGLGGSTLSARAGVRLQGQTPATAAFSLRPYLALDAHQHGRTGGRFDEDVLPAVGPRRAYTASAGAQLGLANGWSAQFGLVHARGDAGYRQSHANAGVSYHW